MYTVLLSIYQKEQPKCLKQSLDSIFNQTIFPSEVVLVKDGPLTCELDILIEEYLQKYPILKIISLSTNQGLGCALNEGLKYCSNNLIVRMDTDDIAMPIRAEEQLNVFEKYPDVDVVGAWVNEFIDDISNIISVRKLPEWHDEIFAICSKRNPMNHPVVMFKKVCSCGSWWISAFSFLEDYYLWIRMLLSGAKFYNIQKKSFVFSLII